MPESPTESAPGTWSVPECPFTIAYVPEVMDDIRLAVMDAFFSLPRGGAEIGGILLGWHTQRRVTVAGHVPLDCEHATGPSFVLSARDEAKLSELLDQAKSNPEGLQPVGWYHSHTRSDIFLSDADLEIHRRFFPEPWQVALVLKPHTFQPMRGGFFFREPDGSVQSTVSYQEFELEVLPMRPVPSGDAPPMAAGPVMPVRQSDAGRMAIDVSAEESAPRTSMTVAEEPTAVTEASKHLDAPRFATVSSEERSWLWLRAILALSLGLVVGAVAVQTRQIWKPRLQGMFHSTPITPASLALSTFDRDGQLQIHWDGLSPAVSQASSGVLSIVDGGLIGKEVHLDLEHLKSGIFSYERESGQVDVVLAVHESDGPTVRAVAAFVGKVPIRAAYPSAPVESGKPAAGTDAQVAKLKRDLAGEQEQVKKMERLLADQSLLVSSADKMKKDLAAQIERNKKLEKSLSDARAQAGEAMQAKKELAAANERIRSLDNELKQQQRKRMGAQDPAVAKQQ